MIMMTIGEAGAMATVDTDIRETGETEARKTTGIADAEIDHGIAHRTEQDGKSDLTANAIEVEVAVESENEIGTETRDTRTEEMGEISGETSREKGIAHGHDRLENAKAEAALQGPTARALNEAGSRRDGIPTLAMSSESDIHHRVRLSSIHDAPFVFTAIALIF